MKKFMEYWGKKDIVEQLIWLTAIALLVVVGSFSAYYYFDRYVALNDISPDEIAIEELLKIIDETPDDPNLRLLLANQYYQSEQYKNCIDTSYKVIELYGDEYDSMYFLAGLSYIRLGDTDEGLPVLERFIELRSNSPMANSDDLLHTANYYAGDTYFNMGDYEAALLYLESALEGKMMDADTMFRLGQAYAATEQHELALDQFHTSVRFVPEYYEVYGGMIESYTALGDSDKVAYARGMQLYIEQDYDGALAHIFSAYEADPEFVPALLGLGMAYEKLGDYDFALLYLNEVLIREPDNFMANHVVGRIQEVIQSQE